MDRALSIPLQEHFKNTKSTNKYFGDHFDNKRCFVIPAFWGPDQLTGRSAGGLVQLSDKLVTNKIDKIIQKSWRIQAQVIHLPSCKLLWINSYLPNDPGPAAAAWDKAWPGWSPSDPHFHLLRRVRLGR